VLEDGMDLEPRRRGLLRALAVMACLTAVPDLAAVPGGSGGIDDGACIFFRK
jgi:hypothetical protein